MAIATWTCITGRAGVRIKTEGQWGTLKYEGGPLLPEKGHDTGSIRALTDGPARLVGSSRSPLGRIIHPNASLVKKVLSYSLH